MTPAEDLIESLPHLHRLALSYAPRHARRVTLGLMAFDNRLAGIVRRSSEPMLAQIRLAWWRELLAQNPEQWPKGEPLLVLLREWEGRVADLTKLVDAWEACVGSEADLEGEDIRRLAQARGAAFGAIADMFGHSACAPDVVRMGGEWALADLAVQLARPIDRDAARTMMADATWRRRWLPSALRPLAILHALAARSARKGIPLDRLTAASLIPVMRIGLFGR